MWRWQSLSWHKDKSYKINNKIIYKIILQKDANFAVSRLNTIHRLLAKGPVEARHLGLEGGGVE